jgi:hypothetical protein
MKTILLLAAFLAASEPPTTEAVVQSSERITLRLQGIGGDGYYLTEVKDLVGNTHKLLLPSEAQPRAGQKVTIVHDGLPYVVIQGARFYDYSTAKIAKP